MVDVRRCLSLHPGNGICQQGGGIKGWCAVLRSLRAFLSIRAGVSFRRAFAGIFPSKGRGFYFFFGNVVTNFGMGRQEGAILLDPRDVDMAFGPTFEYHADGRNIKAGLDHHCFHQIDVPEWNTLYWNKLFLSYGSSNFRQGDYWKQLGRPGNSGWRERLSWQAGYGYFMHSLGGVLDTNALSWGHSYVHGAWLWTETMGCEAMTVRGSFGVSLFVHWIAVDQSIIRENRDKLVEVGARVFK